MTQTNPTQAALDLCIALGIPDHHAPTIQAAFAEREARLVGAMKWAGEVSPPVNDFGCVTVDMSLVELNTMRALAGFKPLSVRKDRTHG